MPLIVDRRVFLKQGAVAAGLLAWPRDTGIAADDATKGLVVGQPEGAEAGRAVLASGGNAVDAIVSAALVAGVVAVPSTGIGGYGGHLVIARPDGKSLSIDFNSAAPGSARPDMFSVDDKGVAKARANVHGWLAAGVPGVLAGLQLALDRFGTKKFGELVKPAIRLAREGFTVRANLANAIASAQERLLRDPECTRWLLPGGRPLSAGETFKNPALADMLQALADDGRVDAFYDGKIARQIAASFRKNGGLVTEKDLAAYRALEVAPLAIKWQGCTIHTPPPTSGGLTVLQALNTLQALDWAHQDPHDPSTVQARVEALRIAWDDRLRLLGDSRFASVPIDRLLSERYAQESAERIRVALREQKPVVARSDGRSAGGTIHLCAADASGLMVALTFTHGDAFGASVAVERLGLILGHGMSRFEPRPGHPNSVAAGKRPLHNMCPTVVTKDGKPLLALGAVGGRKIPNTVFDVLTYRLGQGQKLSEAVRSPRLHTIGDLALVCESTWPKSATDRFATLGYTVRTGTAASLSALERDGASGSLESAAR
jgi:gamma-glutamyltranspeptidase/glutathione hydrolase